MSERVTVREYQTRPGVWVVEADFAHRLADELEKAKERIEELEEFVRSCADNFDCDHEAHKWSTQCRACDAQRLIDAKEAKP
jgi:hypothetical protein